MRSLLCIEDALLGDGAGRIFIVVVVVAAFRVCLLTQIDRENCAINFSILLCVSSAETDYEE